MTVLNCRVEQTSNRTMYNVQEINGTDCNLTWANGTNVNLNCSPQVFFNITTLITTDCYKSIFYTLGCVEGIFTAACTANCTENSDDVIRPEGNYNGLSCGAWVGIAIAIALVILFVVALVIYLVIKNSCSSQARSANHQPDARYESRNNEESVELNANRSHEQP